MSYQQTTLFRCDEAGCVTEFQSWWIPLEAARDHAAENGWAYRSGFDFCPLHSTWPSPHQGRRTQIWGRVPAGVEAG
jgi:hypothetical protein